MRIQHNISALNSWGKLGINQNAAAKNLEKLSSGYRINRAGDDAAGLAISEKMRGQIRGLDMASKNAQDGISLIQTAEGALDETHSILQRMRELAVQSANGTYQDEDRANTDLEIQALKSELDRIASSTHFNKIQLLDGSLSAGGTKGTAGKAAATVTVSDAALSDGAMKIHKATQGEYTTETGVNALQDNVSTEYTILYDDENGKKASTTVTLKYIKDEGRIVDANGDTLANADPAKMATSTANALKAALDKSDLGSKFKIEVGNGTGAASNGIVENGLQFTAKTAGTNAPRITGIHQNTAAGSTQILGSGTKDGTDFILDFSNIDVTKFKAGDTLTIGGVAITFTDNPATVTGVGVINLASIEGGAASLVDAINTALTGKDLTFSYGASASDNKVTCAIDTDPTKLKLTLSSSLANTDNGLDADQVKIMDAIKYETNGFTATGGIIGIGDAMKSYDVKETVQALDRYESYNMASVGVWTGKEDSNIEDHLFTVDGKKFLFVKDNSDAQDISDTNLAKAIAKYGNDLNVVSVKGDTVTAEDVVKMVERIKEKTSTNVVANGTELSFLSTQGTEGKPGDGKLVFQIGANGDADQRVSMSIDDMSSEGIGVDAINILTADSANAAIDIVDKAINTVSATRANLGAMQNRLEHTINSLNTTSENLSAAESRIRDVDMAKEMMAFTKNNILTQAAQAMLAQANQQPQGVLQLLQ